MVRRFFSQAWLYCKGRTAAFRPLEFICLDAGYPLVTLIFYCLLASYSFGTTDLTYWVVGNAFLLCTNVCIFGLGGVFNGERYYGRLRSIVAAPCSTLALVLASGVFPALMAAVTVAVGFLLGGLIFGVSFAGVDLGLVALSILAAMWAATGFGLLLSACSLLTDSMHLLLNIVSFILMLCTGAEVPLSQLPGWARFLSNFLPMTRSMAAVNLLFDGGGGERFFSLLAGELLVGLGFFLLAWAVLRLTERAARRAGKFDLF